MKKMKEIMMKKKMKKNGELGMEARGEEYPSVI